MADTPVDVVARALGHWGSAADAIAALTTPEMREALVTALLEKMRWLDEPGGQALQLDAIALADAVMAWLRGEG